MLSRLLANYLTSIHLTSTDFRYVRFAEVWESSGDSSDNCTACPVGTYADNSESLDTVYSS